MRLTRGVPLLVGAGFALAIAGAGAAAAPAAAPFVCSGKLHKPGVLKGTYPNGVLVKGVCAVNSGPAHVIGTLHVTRGSVLAAAFGRHHSRLRLTGNLLVDRGGAAILGCKVNPDHSGFPCIDDHAKVPTLTSHPLITGNVIANSPLGLLVHNATIRGKFQEIGGGGGVSCKPAGVFNAFHSPPYSDIEDTVVHGNVSIRRMNSCWLGLARDGLRGSVTINNNTMGDPDAIEVLANHITKNLSCNGNSHPAATSPPGTEPVWDSTETSMTPGVIYPRHAEPNTVGGTRSGQCVQATPTTQGGPSGPPGSF